MEDTCEPKECKLFDLLGGEPNQCPNYVEGWWQPQEGEPKLVKDCSPKRLLLMMRTLELRFFGVQKSSEEQRNETNRVMDVFTELIKEIGKRKNTYIEDSTKTLIEEK